MEEPVYHNAPPQASAVLLSYARPENIQRIYNAVAGSRYIENIVVSNNNPDIDLWDYLEPHPKLKLIQQVVHQLPWNRFSLPLYEEGDFFISIDDDLFLTTEQIDLLLEKLFADPGISHGAFGQVLARDGMGFTLVDCVTQVDREIDVLNRVYAFTKEQAARVFQLLELLGLNHARKIGLYEDILLSFGASKRPLCHDLGALEECKTTSDPRKALHMRPGFFGLREQLVIDLIKKMPMIPWLDASRCTVNERVEDVPSPLKTGSQHPSSAT